MITPKARAAFSGVATRAELKARYEARRKPVAAPALTPPGVTQSAVHTQIDQANEKRIAYLESRLGRASERLREGRSHMSPHPSRNAHSEKERS